MKLREVKHNDGAHYGWRFECPGCGHAHVVPDVGPHAWGFNGSADRPTFTPSILVRCRVYGEPAGRVCHSFVTDGRIQFLSDSVHALAGQTVDLPEIEP